MIQFLQPGVMTVLDVGCSSGAFGEQLRATSAGLRLVGVEPNADAAAAAESVFDEVVVGNFPDVQPRLPVGERYDAIYFNDVLEHMPDPEGALRAARDVIASGGQVIASIPNVRHVSVIGPLIVRGEFKYRQTGILDRTHVRFFTASSIVRTFQDEGWDIVALQGINCVLRLGEIRSRWWIRVLGWMSRGWTNDFFYVQYVVVARLHA